MRGSSGLGVVAFLAAMLAMPGAFAAAQRPKVDEIISLHDLDTSVSIGIYHLEQEPLVSNRALLARPARDKNLSVGWNTGNAYSRQAEEALLERMLDRVDREFANLAWLRTLWTELDRNVLDEQELDTLIAYLCPGVGRKRLRFVDRTVSMHVMMTLSFCGVLKTVPDVEGERARSQELRSNEDKYVRFSIQDSANAGGQAFSLSLSEKKYSRAAILNLRGIVSQRIVDFVLQPLREVEQHGETVRPYVDGFKSAQI